MLSNRNVERIDYEGGQYNPASEFMPFLHFRPKNETGSRPSTVKELWL